MADDGDGDVDGDGDDKEKSVHEDIVSLLLDYLLRKSSRFWFFRPWKNPPQGHILLPLFMEF